MKNKEKFKEEIMEIACKGKSFAFTKDGKISFCCKTDCNQCVFNSYNGASCNVGREIWCNEEYVEPCEFKKGELVETRQSQFDLWTLRYFAYEEDGDYYCYIAQEQHGNAFPWKYCRKYGSLGKESMDE